MQDFCLGEWMMNADVGTFVIASILFSSRRKWWCFLPGIPSCFPKNIFFLKKKSRVFSGSPQTPYYFFKENIGVNSSKKFSWTENVAIGCMFPFSWTGNCRPFLLEGSRNFFLQYATLPIQKKGRRKPPPAVKKAKKPTHSLRSL